MASHFVDIRSCGPTELGPWGDWYYTPEDGCLNLVRKNTTDTFQEPFYYIHLNTIKSWKDICFWIHQLNGKNLDLYGDRVSIDLIHAFWWIYSLTAARQNFIPRNSLTWDGDKFQKDYSRYHRKNKSRGISKTSRIEILDRDNYTCQTCGAKAPHVELHVDHKQPLSKGGTNKKSNLWTLCAECNLGKSDKILNNIWE